MNAVATLMRGPRTKAQALADLTRKLADMPLNDRRRGEIVRQIVGLEDEISEARNG